MEMRVIRLAEVSVSKIFCANDVRSKEVGG